jgi:hypothetical protein
MNRVVEIIVVNGVPVQDQFEEISMSRTTQQRDHKENRSAYSKREKQTIFLS